MTDVNILSIAVLTALGSVFTLIALPYPLHAPKPNFFHVTIVLFFEFILSIFLSAIHHDQTLAIIYPQLSKLYLMFFSLNMLTLVLKQKVNGISYRLAIMIVSVWWTVIMGMGFLLNLLAK